MESVSESGKWVAARGQESLHESCGVIGVYAPGLDVARTTFYGLYALQHRGQESAGIATATGKRIHNFTSMGLVSQAFRETDLERLEGHIAIGHTRYSTTGSTHIRNAQPVLARSGTLELALAHNGNVINAEDLRRELAEWGCSFTSTSDSEVIAQLLACAPGQSWPEKASYMMRRLQGAYSLTVLTKDTLLGFRDPYGVRPLCLGKLDGGWVIASESCALDHLGAQYLREVEPGETVIVDQNGLTCVPYTGELPPTAPCVFEYIYFARPDSLLGGRLTYLSRQAMGRQLAREYPADADIVIGIPDSAGAAAVGYAQEIGIPYSDGLVKNRYVGRTFIEPDQRFRDLGVRMKFNPLPEVIRGQRIIIVDDSIVRGTTTPHVVNMVRKAGATEIHMRVCAPPIRFPCHFGVDMATQRELIAANMSVDEIRQFIQADTLGYLSVEGLLKTVRGDYRTFCAACFTGQYPIPVQLEMDKLALERQ
ncbi:MAG: amidophosphoribosyltransferase [Dehalococcoidia bacterium]